MKADFSLSHVRDRLPSLLGAAVLVEVKPPGELDNAKTQVLSYARRRMRELFAAARLRGDVPLHQLQVFAVATDGLQVVVLRVLSGAPEQGSFKGAVPCPSFISPPLPLLSGWDFVTGVGHLPETPPEGWVALSRLLCSDADALVGSAVLPLSYVRAELTDHSPPCVTLELGIRLGCGGTSDAYALLAGTPQVASGAVLKLARGATKSIVKAFDAEETALRTLAGVQGVPLLLHAGRRAGWPSASLAGTANVRWPLLVLAPLGVPLEVELSGRSGAPLAALKRAFADELLTGLHATLRAAHIVGLVHCDVRPANCVFAGGRPLLLDWGLARADGEDARGCGDALFTVEEVHSQQSFSARPWADLASAALVWVAIVYGPELSCTAPWHARSSVDRTLAMRRRWLQSASAADASVRAVVERVESAAARRGLPRAEDYTWLPPVSDRTDA